jgi:hypothetical protein
VISSQRYDAEFVSAALDPESPSAPRSFIVERDLAANFGRHKSDLQTYATVFLLNVRQLAPEDWGALNHYVHQGGGLVVAPGHLSEPNDYNNVTAGQFLPAQLETRSKAPRPSTTIGKLVNITHPIFERYGKDLDTMLSLVPVYRYWPVKELAADTRTLLSFGDAAPALVERTFKGPKTGRVLLWTTPLSRLPDTGGQVRSDPGAWNELPMTTWGWSFLVLMQQTVPYLANASNETLNFEAGENVLLKLDPTTRFSNFLLTGPDQKTKPGMVHSPSSEFLEIDAPAEVGLWTVKAIAADNKTTTMGFSVNPPLAESKFAELQKSDLDTIFGKDGYLLAEDAQTHVNVEGIRRYGYEIFPWLMFVILLVVTLENFLANTFYKEAPRPKTAGAVS